MRRSGRHIRRTHRILTPPGPFVSVPIQPPHVQKIHSTGSATHRTHTHITTTSHSTLYIVYMPCYSTKSHQWISYLLCCNYAERRPCIRNLHSKCKHYTKSPIFVRTQYRISIPCVNTIRILHSLCKSQNGISIPCATTIRNL